jgi:hypothetical protein
MTHYGTGNLSVATDSAFHYEKAQAGLFDHFLALGMAMM